MDFEANLRYPPEHIIHFINENYNSLKYRHLAIKDDIVITAGKKTASFYRIDGGNVFLLNIEDFLLCVPDTIKEFVAINIGLFL